MKNPNDKPKINSIPVVGLSMAIGMGFLAWLGVMADKKFNSSPWGALIGLGLGLFYCGYEFWKLIRQSKDEEKK